MEDKPTVVITGIAGYLGSRVTLMFLQDGGFKVRGTVRNKTRADKIDPLKVAFGELFDQLELVEADLNDEASMIAACEGCTYAVHTASPFWIKPPENPDDMIKPAVEGTLGLLRGAVKHGLKRVVVTSSSMAIMVRDSSISDDVPFDETHWSVEKNQDTYGKSKTMAERAAWAHQKENPSYELVTMNPGFIMGPNLNKCSFQSGDYVVDALKGTKTIPFCMPLVDVRDVAQAHLEGIKRPAAAGNRYMLSGEAIFMNEINGALADKFPQYKASRKPVISKCMMSCLGTMCCNQQMKDMGRKFGKMVKYDNTKARTELGIDFRDPKVSIVELAEVLIEQKYPGMPEPTK